MAETQDVIEREQETDDDVTETTVEPESGMTIDRSRCQLRLPSALVAGCLQFAHALKLSRKGIEGVAVDSALIDQLRNAEILLDDELDPQVAHLLAVVNQASLIITVELRYGSDTSASTVWATPRQAVVSASIDPAFAELRPVDVFQLPYVLSDLMVARPPSTVSEAPISVATQAIAEAQTVIGDRAQAIEILTKAGLSDEQAGKVIDFQNDDVRQWRIHSTWSTETGQDSSELRGIDAGPNGQWLVAMIAKQKNGGQLTFTPQGHGDVMRAIRSVMPKSWLGTPLNTPATP